MILSRSTTASSGGEFVDDERDVVVDELAFESPRDVGDEIPEIARFGLEIDTDFLDRDQ